MSSQDIAVSSQLLANGIAAASKIATGLPETITVRTLRGKVTRKLKILLFVCRNFAAKLDSLHCIAEASQETVSNSSHCQNIARHFVQFIKLLKLFKKLCPIHLVTITLGKS